MASKLAADSMLDLDDQARLYRETMGAEAAARQERAAKLSAGKCVCSPQKVRKKWDGDRVSRTRTVHATDCPKHQGWMHD